jgi:hypothetical protein
MNRVEFGHHLQFEDYLLFNNQIEPVPAAVDRGILIITAGSRSNCKP